MVFVLVALARELERESRALASDEIGKEALCIVHAAQCNHIAVILLATQQHNNRRRVTADIEILNTPQIIHYSSINRDMTDSEPLPVPAQLEAQLGKCKSSRPPTYYKSREKTAAVSLTCLGV